MDFYKSQTPQASGKTTAYPAVGRLIETEMGEMKGRKKRK